MIDTKFPDVGEGITEGMLVKWLVKVGDEIKADQAVAEIETDKAIVEIPTSKGGKVSKLYGKEGDTIKVGNPLVSLSLPGEEEVAGARPEAKPELKPEAAKPEVKPEVKIIEAPSRVLAAPSTRRLARELGIDISKVTG